VGEHIANMGEERKVYTKFRWESPKERDHSEDRCVHGRKGSKWILGRLAGRWSRFSWLRIWIGSGLL
jgi:hypothetical protein